MHSAAWPKELDYTNKRVAVIGNGSSGVQIVTEIQSSKLPTMALQLIDS